PQDDAEAHALADQLRSEFVIGIEGLVIARTTENVNSKLPTGGVEVRVKKLLIYSKADTTPFEIVDDTRTNEDVRLKYRYLDLRRPVMQQNLMLRSQIAVTVRNYFHENKFVEVETPVLMKSTPEGA